MTDLPAGQFGAILADPPWRSATFSANGRGRCPDGPLSAKAARNLQRQNSPERHYATMALDDIKALPVASAAVRKLLIAPRREHSRKPDETHQRIEALVAGPYLELFARKPREGWTVWGNQIDRFEDAA